MQKEESTRPLMLDPVTSLPDRSHFVGHLSQSVERARRYEGFHFGVLRIDLDAAGSSGETNGSLPEAMLVTAARRLQKCLRTTERPHTFRNNDLVAHLDGGCFVILLDGLKKVEHVTTVASRMLAELRRPVRSAGQEVRLSASIGIAVSTTRYHSAEEVLRDASMAVARARQLGGDRCEAFDAAALDAAHTELRLEAELAGALERGEFLLLYQPIVSLDGEAIVGFEALARWQHPGLGLISPADFIPIAERTGFIVPLGAWALRRACSQIAAWQQAGLASPDMWVAVNVSSVQFADPALAQEVVEILRETRLDPRCLTLELTEGAAMDNPGVVSALLTELRALGVRVSVDDFGTGHSSLAYLRQLPVDYLKIDRSFVRGIDASDDMRGIFAAVAAMARQLNLRVIAEGIETPGQLAFVRALDAQLGQGFLLSRPVDGNAAEALLAAGLPVRPRENIDTTPAVAPAFSLLGRAQPRRTRGAWLYASSALVAVALSIGLPRLFDAGETVLVPRTTGTDIVLKPGPPPPLPTQSSAPRGPRGPSPAPRPRHSQHAESVPVAVPAPLRVVHLHRLGSCTGELIVTREGLSFVPEDGSRKDAFTLKHHEYLPMLEDGDLTIRSSDRVYRFKATDAPGGAAQLAGLAHSLTQLRSVP